MARMLSGYERAMRKQQKQRADDAAMAALYTRQESIDRFYWAHGPCCAGCDYWRAVNSVAGECTMSRHVPQDQRAAPLGITGASIHIGAGHTLTPRDGHCARFTDAFDWNTLTPVYRSRVGAL